MKHVRLLAAMLCRHLPHTSTLSFVTKKSKEGLVIVISRIIQRTRIRAPTFRSPPP